MKQWRNVIQVSNSKLGESLLNDCIGALVDYVADGERTSVLDLTEKHVACERVCLRSLG